MKLNLCAPVLLRNYLLSNPRVLARSGRLLFVCDGDAGLNVYDASDPLNLRRQQKISVRGTYDVMAQNGLLLLVAEDGLHQYRYNTGAAGQPLTELSCLGVR